MKGFAFVVILCAGIAFVVISWDPHMTQKIGQGSSLKLSFKNKWTVTTSSPSGDYWPLTAKSDVLGVILAIRSGRLFMKKINENSWSYYTDIIYADQFSLSSYGEILMDGEIIYPKEETSLQLDELYRFEPGELVNASSAAGVQLAQ
jgi:hypothetical protein